MFENAEGFTDGTENYDASEEYASEAVSNSSIFDAEHNADIGSQDDLVNAFQEIIASPEGSAFTFRLTADIDLNCPYENDLRVTAGHTVTLLGQGHTLNYLDKNINIAGGTLNLGSEFEISLPLPADTAKEPIPYFISTAEVPQICIPVSLSPETPIPPVWAAV